MANFPITYSTKIPTAKVGAVHPRIDVSTGESQIGRGLSQVGEALFNIGLKLQKAQDDVEFSTLKRQYDERMAQALNDFSLTGEDKIFQDATKDVETTIVSKNERVNARFKEHYNNTIGQWYETFLTKKYAIRKNNIKNQALINIQKAGEMGDVNGVKDSWELLKSHFPEMKAEADEGIKNAPLDTVLMRARIEVDRNPQLALAMLNEPEFRKKLSGKQLDEADKLQRMAQQTLQMNTDAIENEVIYGLHTNRNKTLIERAAIGEDYINKLRLANVSPARFDKMVGDIEKWMTGEARPNDSMVYVDLVKDVERLKSGIGEPSEVRRKIRDSYSKLDDQHFESITKMLEADIPSFQADETGKILRYAEKQLVTMDEPTWMQFMSIAKGKELQNATSKRQLEFWNLSEYDKELRDWITKNPDAKRDEIYIESRKLLAHYRKRTIPQIKTLMEVKEAAALTVEEMTKRAEIVMRQEKRIKVRSPDGKLFTIPKNQKEEAVNQGYVILE